jgi:hypothetical protein
VYWDGDSRKDLLVGQADGKLRLYTNTNTDDDPEFDGGTLLQVGEPDLKIDIDVGERATPVVVDWNNDGKKDIVVGDKLGGVRVFVNAGTDTVPDFPAQSFVQNNGGDILVDGLRPSPHVADFTDDGRKDLLVGNTNGQLLLYENTGTDEAPEFSGFVYVSTAGMPIDLSSSRSRPFACDWTGDGSTDVLIGSSDGLVRLYQGVGHMAGVDQIDHKVPLAKLGSAYPNPFNPRVTIPFSMTDDGRVRITIHDTSGRLVAVLLDDVCSAGCHVATWRGTDASGRPVASGVYLARLESDSAADTGKLVLLR